MREIQVTATGVRPKELAEIVDFLRIIYGGNVEIKDEGGETVIEIKTTEDRSDIGVKVAAAASGYEYVTASIH